MPLGRGIKDLLEAIPERIEVAGRSPTWRVTGGSFEAVVRFVEEAFESPVVLGRQDRGRWWPRVTLTVTTDPAAAAHAPAIEELADPRPVTSHVTRQVTRQVTTPVSGPEPGRRDVRARQPVVSPQPLQTADVSDVHGSTLEAMFAYQDEVRRSIPRQRGSSRHPRGGA
jgi:hypothetical protein